MWRQSFLLAFRTMRRRKGLAAAHVIIAAVAIAGLMIPIAMLDAYFWGLGSATEQSRTLYVFGALAPDPRGNMDPVPLEASVVDRLFRDLDGVQRLSVATKLGRTTVPGHWERPFEVMAVDDEFWRLEGLRPAQGRPPALRPTSAGRREVVVSWRFADLVFAGQSPIGRTIGVRGDSAVVVGVLDTSRLGFVGRADLWVPLAPDDLREHHAGVEIRLVRAPGVSSAHVRDQVRARVAALAGDAGAPALGEIDFDPSTLDVEPKPILAALCRELGAAAKIRSPQVTIPALVLGVLLLGMVVPALALVSLLLGRLAERRSEVGIRRAFGAPRGALVAQFVFENVATTFVGGAFALILLELLARAVDPQGQFGTSLLFRGRLLQYGAGLTVAFGVLSGVPAALKLASQDPIAALRGRTT